MAAAAGFGDSIGHSHALAGMLPGSLAGIAIITVTALIFSTGVN